MKIEITTSPKGFEAANFLLSLAIDQASNLDDKSLKNFGLSKSDLKKAESLRKSMVDGFFKYSETLKQ